MAGLWPFDSPIFSGGRPGRCDLIWGSNTSHPQHRLKSSKGSRLAASDSSFRFLVYGGMLGLHGGRARRLFGSFGPLTKPLARPKPGPSRVGAAGGDLINLIGRSINGNPGPPTERPGHTCRLLSSWARTLGGGGTGWPFERPQPPICTCGTPCGHAPVRGRPIRGLDRRPSFRCGLRPQLS